MYVCVATRRECAFRFRTRFAVIIRNRHRARQPDREIAWHHTHTSLRIGSACPSSTHAKYAAASMLLPWTREHDAGIIAGLCADRFCMCVWNKRATSFIFIKSTHTDIGHSQLTPWPKQPPSSWAACECRRRPINGSSHSFSGSIARTRARIRVSPALYHTHLA